MSNRNFAIVCLCGIAVISTLLYGNRNKWFEGPRNAELVDAEPSEPNLSETDASETSPASDANREKLAAALGIPVGELVESGGVTRPKRDLGLEEKKVGDYQSPKSPFPANLGRPQPLNGDENEQVAGLIEELSIKNGPAAARSVYIAPAKFDLAAYQADPAAYLNKIRPGRVNFPAQPGPDVVPIATLSDAYSEVLQGETILFKVKAEPGMPITAFTQQIGRFSNQLNTISVMADEDGVASIAYNPGPGSLGLNDVTVASPVHSGQLHFVINVSLPSL